MREDLARVASRVSSALAVVQVAAEVAAAAAKLDKSHLAIASGSDSARSGRVLYEGKHIVCKISNRKVAGQAFAAARNERRRGLALKSSPLSPATSLRRTSSQNRRAAAAHCPFSKDSAHAKRAPATRDVL